ncbi:MAG TPA: hypothetical protein PKC43_12275 [Phycisphaerales bacterium]|nr:hypothetical protein [Phycisphaerales bacterium]HMP38209.1 hypothetical protein [Phycisphaerales bacterium]
MHRSTPATAIHRQVERLRHGEDPTVVARTGAGWVVLGSPQVARGYCLLLPDPVVPRLNDLDQHARQRFLLEMATLGDAILAVTGAARINYEILGNLEPALHAHVFPRSEDEPDSVRTRPIWFHDWSAAPTFDRHRDAALIEALAAELRRLGIVVEDDAGD